MPHEQAEELGTLVDQQGLYLLSLADGRPRLCLSMRAQPCLTVDNLCLLMLLKALRREAKYESAFTAPI